MAGKKIIFSEE
jgi:transposase-like protein